MVSNSTSRRLLSVAVAALTSALVVPLLAQDSKGDLWETTSQMSMDGMPMKMPANTAKVCSAKNWTEPPGSADKQRNCKNSNMKAVGSKITWEVACTGPTMTGAGEIIREGADSYSGAIKFTSAQGSMTVKLTGRKIGGCDNPQ